jgi:hypothetical protein
VLARWLFRIKFSPFFEFKDKAHQPWLETEQNTEMPEKPHAKLRPMHAGKKRERIYKPIASMIRLAKNSKKILYKIVRWD